MMKTALAILLFSSIAAAFEDLTQSVIEAIKADVLSQYAKVGYVSLPAVNRLSKDLC